MKNIIKKRLPDHINDRLQRGIQDEEGKTYYLIDGEFYIHIKFYLEEENPSLTLLHDVAFVESIMIRDMKAKDKVYLDENNTPFFDLRHVALWFFDNLPSKDWRDLLGFLRILREYNGTANYIEIPSTEEQAH